MFSPRSLFFRFFLLIVLVIAGALVLPLLCYAQLSQNSGINSADTWVAIDLTVTASGAVTLPNSFYNPATGTTSNLLSFAPPTQTFHMEAGYDSSGGLVMNVWPTGTPANPGTTDIDAIGFIRFAGGQMTVFAQNGIPLSPGFPSGVPTTWPLALFGSNPGPSVLQHLVVPNIPNYANGIHAEYVSYQTYAYVTPTMPSGSNATWTYVPSGSNWIAKNFAMTVPVAGGSVTRTIQFANMNWYDNATNDSARASKGYTATTPPAATGTNPSGLTAGSPTSNSTTVYQLGGTQNVLFQHGIFSSGATWTRMKNWLNQDFRFGTEIIPSLNSTDSLSNQGTALLNEMNSVGGNNYILIGHSQGGLISRYAAQQYQSANPQQTVVGGVITLDTPHEGAPAALTGGVAMAGGLGYLAVGLWDWTGCSTAYDNFVCYMAALTYVGGSAAAEWWYNTSALGDLIPGSSFLNQLNGYPESFKRAGVVSYTPMRFNEVRIMDDFIFLPTAGCYPETWCGERVMATDVQITYDVVEAWFFFCLFEEIFNPDDSDYWAALADQLFGILFYMDAIDYFWNGVVSGFAPSDALVPASSQNYPYTAAVQYPINGADSHTGATTSTYVHGTLYQVLNGSQFQVPTQAGCSFSASPTSYSISASGGTSSFGISTGAGCQWSAVSSTPWISITAGSSGTSTGNISFSVAANPVTLTRTGTITVGNASSSATFTVQEAGLCTYGLSAYAVSIPSGGGSATVTVYTQNDNGCVWSAVPNESWITITSGASGTATGSFTLSAAANPGDTDLLGTVTIMSQTLSVILGNPIGTPGTGSITINGSPKYIYVCKPGCATGCAKSCATLTYEYGTVYLGVGGDTYSASYSGGETAAQLVANLANAINSGSLVSASVSGSTITLTSKVNGSLTNYSLSTSYTYDTTHFSSPAFTGSTSGASLTGGTD
jgi:pimeloyl-ACP methyl ester carboxylesterase